MFSCFYFIPLVAAIACWLCVSLMLYFIFKPEKRVNILGFKIQGLLYAKQQQLNKKLTDGIVRMALSKKEEIIHSATAEENIEQLMPQIETHIQEFLTVRVPQELPMIAMFLGEKTTHQIKDVFIKELRSLFPQVIAQYISTVLDENKLHQLIATQITSSSEIWMNTAFQQYVRPFFFRIKCFAFIAGGVIGGVAALLISLFA